MQHAIKVDYVIFVGGCICWRGLIIFKLLTNTQRKDYDIGIFRIKLRKSHAYSYEAAFRAKTLEDNRFPGRNTVTLILSVCHDEVSEPQHCNLPCRTIYYCDFIPYPISVHP